MIKLTYFRLLAFLSIILVIGVTSCDKKDNLPNNGKAALYSFGPTGTKIGETLRFIGVNLDQVSSIKFTGKNAVVDKASFKLQDGYNIQVVVPQAAEKGTVTLRLSSGDSIVTKTPLNLSVLATITSITAQARPGDNITINGTYLNWIDKITFFRDKKPASFVSQSQTQIVVKVPDDAQTGTLVLHYGGTDSANIETKDTLKVTLPIATSFAPNPVKHGTNVTITGTDLDLVKKVYFNSVSAAVTSFVSQSATSLVVTVPGATTKGKIKLEAASGVQTTSASDLDVALPTIASMTPNPVAPDANVTITGTNLDLVSSANFIGVPDAVTTFVSQSATQLVIKVPTAAISGKLTLNVKNSTLSVKSSTDLSIIGSSVPPIIIYDDAVTSAWNGWVGGGWGGTHDYANTSPVRSGSKSIKVSYVGGWGAPLQLGAASINLGGYTSLKLSIYGDVGSGGKKVNVGLNNQDGYTITLVEGVWTDYTIPLSSTAATTTLTDLIVKEFNGTGGFTIYVDNIGLY
ncbi:MAG TPA: IPT/TIG domain-containing protein [Flavisolibacter sp.]|nr:IPT/TIG domain-containing protein [Flavisolibacter sp.]